MGFIKSFYVSEFGGDLLGGDGRGEGGPKRFRGRGELLKLQLWCLFISSCLQLWCIFHHVCIQALYGREYLDWKRQTLGAQVFNSTLSSESRFYLDTNGKHHSRLQYAWVQLHHLWKHCISWVKILDNDDDCGKSIYGIPLVFPLLYSWLAGWITHQSTYFIWPVNTRKPFPH